MCLLDNLLHGWDVATLSNDATETLHPEMKQMASVTKRTKGHQHFINDRVAVQRGREIGEGFTNITFYEQCTVHM
jgi:hypothetical protein